MMDVMNDVASNITTMIKVNSQIPGMLVSDTSNCPKQWWPGPRDVILRRYLDNSFPLFDPIKTTGKLIEVFSKIASISSGNCEVSCGRKRTRAALFLLAVLNFVGISHPPSMMRNIAFSFVTWGWYWYVSLHASVELSKSTTYPYFCYIYCRKKIVRQNLIKQNL